MRSKKKSDFIWLIWHKAITINSRGARLIIAIDDKCQLCMTNFPETITYGFWDCRVAHRAWDISIGSCKYLV